MTYTQMIALSLLILIGAALLVSGLVKMRTMVEDGNGIVPGGLLSGGLLLFAIAGLKIGGLASGINL